QIVIAFIYRNDAVRAIESLTLLGWLYLGLAAVLFVFGAPSVLRALAGLRAAVSEHRLAAAASAGSGANEAAPKT
ncbi:MAG: hypothetical protein AB7O64_15350, partial [Methylibium sp.]